MSEFIYLRPHAAGQSAGMRPYPEISRAPFQGGGVSVAEKKSLTGTSFVQSVESPCLHCYMVADPQSCNDADCLVWRQWFASRWNAARQDVARQYRQRPLEEVGLLIGGSRYALPHRRREFLAQDPCRDCCCPRSLCHGSCRLRYLWRRGREEVMG